MDNDSRLPDSNSVEDTRPLTTQQASELYEQGMAHYRRREWQEALDCFTRLKKLQPDRRGIEALISELQIFIQLQEIEPETDGQGISTAPPRPSVFATRSEKQGRITHPLLAWGMIALGVLVLLLTVVSFGGNLFLPSRQERDLAQIYDRGQEQLATGNYDEAIATFENLLTLKPGDQPAQAALEQARRLRTIDRLYQEAQQHIQSEDWDVAAQRLQELLAIDPAYRDALALREYVKKEQRLILLFHEGLTFYDQKAWPQARQRFEEINRLDAAYQRDQVRQYLFDVYLKEGLSLIRLPRDSLEIVRRAVARFDDALRIRPHNEQAATARAQAIQYLEAYRAFDRGRWQEAVTEARRLYDPSPDYAAGKLATLLYRSYVEIGKAYEAQEGDDMKALAAYQLALELPVADPSVAQTLEQALIEKLTPTPTATPIPTTTPTITPTPPAITRRNTPQAVPPYRWIAPPAYVLPPGRRW